MCVIGAVILEMNEITVEVRCYFVLMMREVFELNVYLGMCVCVCVYICMYVCIYMVMKVDWMTGNRKTQEWMI